MDNNILINKNKLNNKIDYTGITAVVSLITIFLWILAGVRKIYVYNSLGISLMFLEFNLIEVFSPILKTFAISIPILTLPLFYQKYFRKKFQITDAILFSLGFIFMVSFELFFEAKNNSFFFNQQKLPSLYNTFPMSIIMFLTIFIQVFLLKAPDIMNSVKFTRKIFFDIILAFIFSMTIFLCLSRFELLINSNNQYFTTVTLADREYLLIDNSTSGLIIFDTFKSEINGYKYCSIKYGEYLVINNDNLHLISRNYHYVKVIKP